jgi:cytochrome c oxidase assembly factor CtaG
MLPYLLLADAQNTVLSALLTFSDRVIYPYYESVPRLAGITPLNDQIAAGLIMWVPGSLFFLVPGALIIFHLLSGTHTVDPRAVAGSRREDWDPITAHLATGKGKGAGS